MSAAYIISNSGTATIYFNKNVYTVDRSHQNYNAIVDALKTKVYDNLENLLSIAKQVSQTIKQTEGAEAVEVRDGQIFYQGEVVHNAVCDKILQFVRESFDFKPLVRFLENLMQNPSKASVDNLYRFLDHNKMPITEDGCFLTYKYVRDDYKDVHSGKFDNTPGKTVKMPRNQVQDDPNITCSYGLHVAKLSYASQNGGTRLVICKVNPRDVVSVPTDYNNAKMRVCEYTVLEDYTGKEIKQEEVVGRVETKPQENTFTGYGGTALSTLGGAGAVVNAGDTSCYDEDDDSDLDEEDDNFCDGCGNDYDDCSCWDDDEDDSDLDDDDDSDY